MNDRFTPRMVIVMLFVTGLLMTAAGSTIRKIEQDEFVGFELTGDVSAKPVALKGTSKDFGGIFFKTRYGKTWLTGEPFEKVCAESIYLGKWRFEHDQIVVVSIIANENDFEVSLSGERGPEILEWGFNIPAESDEFFTGLFERTVDGDQKESWAEGIDVEMDLRGQTVDMLIKPTLSMYAPFYVSSRCYGVFVYGTWPGHYDLCKSQDNLVQIRFEGPNLNFKIYTASSVIDIVKRHCLEAGPPICPPKWAFGCWRWRDDHTQRESYYDGTKVSAPYNSEVVEDILMMQALDIPCSVYWVDRPWAKGPFGYDDFEWDTDRLPNPQRMIRWLTDKDIQFLLWIAPWVMNDMANTAVEKGYNLAGQKNWPWSNTGRKGVLIDFTNPDARQWWQQQGLAKVLKEGVKGFKLDRAEEVVPETRGAKAWDGRTTRETRNDYPVQYVRATYEICKEIHGDDFVLMPRAGYTGSSRYGAFWGGDIGSPPEALRTAIIAQLRCSIMGYPLWGSDTGGYWQGDLDREVCARWLAFSCFSPIMEVGPTEDRGFWDMKKEPHYDTELIAIWRLYAKIHTRLIDYSYACAKEAHQTGMPIARPLFLMYPEQKQAWQDWQTFQYGPDILVSAIWEKEKSQHSLYLPKGPTWIDAWTGQTIEGGRMITVDTPLYKIPIFIREGADVDLGDLKQCYRQSLEKASTKPDLELLEQKEFGLLK